MTGGRHNFRQFCEQALEDALRAKVGWNHWARKHSLLFCINFHIEDDWKAGQYGRVTDRVAEHV